jgi:hypothetical protein
MGNLLLEAADWARATPALRAAWPRVIGSAPNAAAVLAVAGAVVALALVAPGAARRAAGSDGERAGDDGVRRGGWARWSEARRTNGGLAGSVAGLLVWELAQPLTPRGIFDWWDVAATIGTALLLRLLWPRVVWLGGATHARTHAHGCVSAQ